MANNVNAIIASITPTLNDVFTNAFNAMADASAQALAKQIAELKEQHDKALATAEHINEQLGNKCMALNKQIEDLTAQLANAKTNAKTNAKVVTMPKANTNEIRHKKFDSVFKVIKAQVLAPYICGPAGSGKNVLAEAIAKALGVDFYMSAKVQQEYQIEGYCDAHGKYNETPFYKAFTQGGVFFLDEMDASNENCLIMLNSAIANRYYSFPGVGMKKAHENFYVIAAGNTTGTGADELYTGRTVLDAASLDRFAFIRVDYDERVEMLVSNNNKELVSFIHDLRKAMDECNTHPFTISYRAIKAITEYEPLFDTLEEVLEMCIVKGMDIDNVRTIASQLSNRSNKYAAAFVKYIQSSIRKAA